MSRTVLTLIIGICIGLAGMWHFVSGEGANIRTGSSAYAEMSASGVPGKTWASADLDEIATFYDEAASAAEDEALEYERTAAAITPLTDTKGFRRSALSIAAQSKWRQSTELRQLAAEHRDKAKRMYAKEQTR